MNEEEPVEDAPCNPCAENRKKREEEEQVAAERETGIIVIGDGSETAPAVEGEKSFGVKSYLKAKTGGEVTRQLAEMRWGICQGCQEKNTETGERLFQRSTEVDAKTNTPRAYCGEAHGLIERRDEAAHGCGCELTDKVRWDSSACPRGRWGPGLAFGTGIVPLWFEGQNDERLQDVIDFIQPTSSKPMDMTGIGDTIGQTIVVQALARKFAGMKRIRFVTLEQRVKWATWLLSGVDIEVVTLDDPEVIPAAERYHSADQRFVEMDETAKLNGWRNRHDYWARRFSLDYEEMVRSWNVPISEEARTKATEFLAPGRKFGRPVIGIAPFSTGTSRNLPMANWMQVIAELSSLGFIVYVLDRPEDGVNKRTRDLGVKLYDGDEPDEIAAVIEQTDLLLTNDSGLGHMGGFVGTKTLAVCGPTSGKIVFSSYPSVEWIQGEGNCQECYWFKENGWKPWCAQGCQLLVRMEISRITDKVEEMINAGN